MRWDEPLTDRQLAVLAFLIGLAAVALVAGCHVLFHHA